MSPTFIVTTDTTTFYSLQVEADSETHAEEIAEMTPLEDWNENNTEGSGFYDVEEVK